MNNPERILKELDRRLNGPVELTIYGRAAIALGFLANLPHHGQTHDVDAIVPRDEVAGLQRNADFWQAQQDLNKALENEDLYITHIFDEDQVIIQPDWKDRREPIPGNYKHLRLYRPATIDLVLTKMMRDDPQDLADIAFLISTAKITEAEIATAIEKARVPRIEELQEQFDKMKPKVLGLTTPSKLRRQQPKDRER